MRILKYVTISILLAAVLLLTSERNLIYMINFAFQPMNVNYEIEMEQKSEVLDDIANQNDVIACVLIDERNGTKNTIERDIYTNVDAADLEDAIHVTAGTYKSLFYSSAVIRIHPLKELAET